MREIKFRQWISTRKTPSMFYDIGAIKDGHFVSPPDVNFSINPLMQFTGLRDKNGKEIYEGDIVRASIYADEDGTNHEVIWDKQGCFCIDYSDGESDGFILGFFPGIMEVIGNTYENPEL